MNQNQDQQDTYVYITTRYGRPVLSLVEVAQVLGISPKTIRKQLASGTFPLRFGCVGGLYRLHARDLANYIDSLCLSSAEKQKRRPGRPRKQPQLQRV